MLDDRTFLQVKSLSIEISNDVFWIIEVLLNCSCIREIIPRQTSGQRMMIPSVLKESSKPVLKESSFSLITLSIIRKIQMIYLFHQNVYIIESLIVKITHLLVVISGFHSEGNTVVVPLCCFVEILVKDETS